MRAEHVGIGSLVSKAASSVQADAFRAHLLHVVQARCMAVGGDPRRGVYLARGVVVAAGEAIGLW